MGILCVGGVAGGFIANDYMQSDAVDSHGSSKTFFPNSGFSDEGANNNQKTNNVNINATVNYNVLSVEYVVVFFQYVDLVLLDDSNSQDIKFESCNYDYIQLSNSILYIPNGFEVSTGQAVTQDKTNFSEIYRNEETVFRIAQISNPSYSISNFVDDISNKSSNIKQFTLQEINGLSFNVYKFEVDNMVFYVYQDGNDIIVVVMSNSNDNLFMYLTQSSNDGNIDSSNPYFPAQVENQEPEEDNSYDDSYYSDDSNDYYDNSGSGDDYYY
jgi:hypothetical protein